MNVDFPSKLQCLFDEQPRYIVLYGGRLGLKSWSVARALLIRGAEKPLRVLCCREIQNSIAESVHHVLKLQIEDLGLSSFYQVLDTEIRGKNGTHIIFSGLKTNITKIKSFEAIDICWIEEAVNVSKASYDVLIPTIRKEGSQIIMTFNPELDTDETYVRFVVSPPHNAVVVKTTYRDNPWLSETSKKDIEALRARDPVAFENVYEGHCKAAVEGAIFAREMQKAQEEGRIMRVPYDPSKPVDIFWDLGRSDKTAMWFVQQIGYEFRFLRYYEDNGQHFSHYLKFAKELPYAYGKQYLPHDAENEQLSAEKTIKRQAQEAFGSGVLVIPRIPKKALAIDAARGIMDRCVWDKELCADGLTCLRKYAYKHDPETQRTSREPDHDTPWSHGADAFMAVGQSMLQTQKPKPPRERPSIIRRSGFRR